MKRRTYLVERSFQLKYTVLLAGWGIPMALLPGLLAWRAYEHARAAPAEGSLSAATSGDAWLLLALVGGAVLSALILGAVGFRMTLRIAGPVHLMGRNLRLLAQGRFPHQRRLRRSDELKALFELFRSAVNALRQREERRTAELEELLASLQAAVPRAPELAPVAARLANDVSARRAALADEATPASAGG